MSDGKLIFDTSLDTTGLAKGLKSLDGKVVSGLKAATGIIGGAATAIAGLGVAAMKVGSGFESSMSGVAATMGITADEIQRGSEEFELLKKAAKDAGETTKYSASQSAEALNYLALAGYDAEKAAAALPAVLNLAAAGNMDLAYAADLATDAMAALGIEATTSNLTEFGDKMAVTAQKSNTSVAQLGEAILTVGGTAKSLAGGTTELNAALGVLANRGIKASEGGTALRNIILALSAPTDKAAGKIKELGIEVYDAAGKMRPINEVFKDLDKQLASMSDDEKTNALNDIFNKVDLKSAQALLAGCGEEFDNLAAAIENSAGAMSEMAATQMDNLTGDIDILKSSLEGLAISFYESNLSDFARKAVQTVTDMVGQLSTALKEGGLEGFAESLGDILADGITKLASKAPDLINAGVKLISSFVDGLNKNADKIAKAAVDIGKALVNGLIKIIPKIIETAGKIMKSFATELGKAVPALKPLTAALGFFADHLKTLVPLILAAYAALKAYTFISSLVATVTKFSDALVIMAAKLYAAATAQTALNVAMSANLIGLVLAGVAALISVIAIFKGKQEEAASATGQLNNELRTQAEESLEAAEKTKEAYAEMADRRNETIASGMAEIEATQHLAQELEGLLDAEGRVKEGEEEHAQTIIDELNGALGLELELVDGLIQGEEDLAAAIDAAIEKKKAQLMLEANEEAYLQALKDKNQAVKDLVDSEEKLAIAQKNYNEAAKDYNTLQAAYDEAVLNNDESYQQLAGDLAEAKARMDNYGETLAECSEAVRENRDVVEECAKDIIKYEDAQTAAMEGNYEKAIEILNDLDEGFITSADLIGKTEEEKNDILKEQYDRAVKERDAMYEAIGDVDSAAADKLRAEFDDYAKRAEEEWRKSAEGNTAAYAEGIAGGEDEITSAAEAVIEASIAGAKNTAESLSPGTGKAIAEGVASGIGAGAGAVAAAAGQMVAAALAEAQARAKINSPSKLFRDEVGWYISEGVAAGIEDGEDVVLEAITDMSNAALKKAWEKGGNWADIGENYVRYMQEGIKDNADEVIDLVKATADSMVDELTAELAEESKDEKKAIKNAGETIVTAYKEAIESGLQEAKELVSEKMKGITSEWQKQRDALLKDQEDMRKKLASFGGELFDYDEEDNMVLKNLNENISALERYDEVMTSLKNKGITDGLLKEITGMDIAKGTQFAEILDEMSETEFAGYINSWEEQQSKATEIATKFYEEEIQTLDDEFSSKLNEALEDIPEMVKDIGINTIEGLAEGMLSKMGLAVEAAQRIADAIQDTLASAMEINSPSRWAKRVIGGQTLAGIALGFKEGMPALKAELEKSMETIKDIAESAGMNPFGAGSFAGEVSNGAAVRETHTKVIEKEKVVGITFNGRLKDVARLLKPSLDDEDRRIGRRLVNSAT